MDNEKLKQSEELLPITNPCVICGEESVEGEITCRQCQLKYGGEKP